MNINDLVTNSLENKILTAKEKTKELREVHKDLDRGKDSEPTNKKLWEQVLEVAKGKFDKWPSSYGSAWAVQEYKRRGGTYKKIESSIATLINDHLAAGIPIRQNMFKVGTETYAKFMETAREMLKQGEIEVDEEDKFILEKLASGRKGIYQGKTVTLDSPTRISNGEKKFRVYTDSGKKDKEGNTVALKIEWGAPGVQIKNDNDEARKSFLARHQCSQKKDKTKPGWWACNVALFAKQLGLKSTKPW